MRLPEEVVLPPNHRVNRPSVERTGWKSAHHFPGATAQDILKRRAQRRKRRKQEQIPSWWNEASAPLQGVERPTEEESPPAGCRSRCVRGLFPGRAGAQGLGSLGGSKFPLLSPDVQWKPLRPTVNYGKMQVAKNLVQKVQRRHQEKGTHLRVGVRVGEGAKHAPRLTRCTM